MELAKLTTQEIHCLKAYIEDDSIKQVAKTLNIAITTVSSYIENIKEKFNCYNKRELLKKSIFYPG